MNSCGVISISHDPIKHQGVGLGPVQTWCPARSSGTKMDVVHTRQYPELRSEL